MPFDGVANVSYYEKNSLIGNRRTYCCGASSGGLSFSAYWPHTAYFCPLCGDIWGRAIYDYNFDYEPRVPVPWVVESRRCEFHGDGAFLTSQPIETVDEALIRRELLILLKGVPNE